MLSFDEAGLAALVARHLDVEPDALTPGTLLAEDLAVDSLAAIELAMMLEDAYDISLPDDVVGQVHAWEDVVALVRRQVVERHGVPQR